MNAPPNRRILVIDDAPAIHEDFRKILGQPAPAGGLDALEADLFGVAPAAAAAGFELDTAHQGREGWLKLGQALAAGRPYALAFVDMRMPPGWDGVETIEQLWRTDPLLQVVICTAHSDTPWDQALARLDAGDRLLILKKPFDAIEVCQLASALSAKWWLARQAAERVADLEGAVDARTGELRQANLVLREEMRARGRLEGRLLQSEKLAAIGQLVAGIAHEINNPVGFVRSNLGTLGDYLDALLDMLAAYQRAGAGFCPAPLAAELERLGRRLELDYLREDIPGLMRETREGLDRVGRIVRDLRDFSHLDSGLDWQWADLHQGIDSTLNIVNHEIRLKADVVKQYGAIPPIECLPTQLNQVVMNLLINAAQAIESGRGRIVIRTGTERDQVWIEIADNGCGIAAEHLERLFDPFFTTKPVGQGTGLGLSVSYGIVQRHHGRIEVRSEPGMGATFRVLLPPRRPPPDPEHP